MKLATRLLARESDRWTVADDVCLPAASSVFLANDRPYVVSAQGDQVAWRAIE